MTLTIIFGIVVLIGVGLILLEKLPNWDYTEWNIILGWVLIIFFGLALVVNLPIWISSNKDSQIKYNQLVSEKISIEAMLETDKTVDRFLLNSAVIDYNNRIIETKTNSTRFILKDYYNQNLDWNFLETIDWK